MRIADKVQSDVAAFFATWTPKTKLQIGLYFLKILPPTLYFIPEAIPIVTAAFGWLFVVGAVTFFSARFDTITPTRSKCMGDGYVQ